MSLNQKNVLVCNIPMFIHVALKYHFEYYGERGHKGKSAWDHPEDTVVPRYT